MKSLRKSNPTLTFNVSEDDVDGSSIERLDIEARTATGRLTKVTLWQDGMAWLYSRARAKNAPSKPTLEIHANLAGIEAEGIAEILRTTLDDPLAAQKEWRERVTPEANRARFSARNEGA
jgi:hypothetical protein